MNPARMARQALNSRLRSSRRCSMSDIEPSAARSNWLGPRRRRTGLTRTPGGSALGRLVHRLRLRHVRRLVVRDLRLQRRAVILRVGLLLDALVVAQALRLGLDDAQRTAQAARRVRQLLRPEQKDQDDYQNRDVPWPDGAHVTQPPGCEDPLILRSASGPPPPRWRHTGSPMKC